MNGICEIAPFTYISMKLQEDHIQLVIDNDGFLKNFKLQGSKIKGDDVEITVDFGDNLKRIGGIMNGGAICTLLDFAGGLAVMNGDGIVNEVTTNLNVQFVGKVATGPVVAKAHVIKRGRTLVHVDMDLRDGSGNVCAKGTGTWYVFR